MRPTQLLTIESYDFPLRSLLCRPNPLAEALLKLLRVDSGKDPIECVVGRNPVTQLEKAPEPLFLRFTESLHVRPVIGVADCRADGDDDDVQQQVPLVVSPWLFQLRKVVNQHLQELVRHRTPPMLRDWSPIIQH